MAATVSSVHAQPRPGMGSLGAHLGVPYFIADSDTRSGEKPRILGQFHFQYKVSPRWRFSTEFGYGWVGYDRTPSPYKLLDPSTGDSITTKVDVLTKIQPITMTALYSFSPKATKWSPFVGVGFNITRLEIVNKRKKIQDPATFAEWVKWSPGVQGELGTELYLQANHVVSLDWSLRGSYQFSKDTKRFPSGFTGNDAYLAASFGVNVYFWPRGKKPIALAPGAAPAPESTPAPEATPAPPDTTKSPAPPDTAKAPAPIPPAPTPATPDTTKSLTPVPAPPDTTKAPAPHGAPPPAETFGAFGVTLPAVVPDPEACANPAVTPRRPEVVEPR